MKKCVFVILAFFCMAAFAQKKQIYIIMGDDEYKTEITLPNFANQVLKKDFDLHYIFSGKEDRNRLDGIEKIENADLVILSIRRLALPQSQLAAFKKYLAKGKPLLAIRTSTHGFALRGNVKGPVGSAQWPEFDKEILGCNYDGHVSTALMTEVTPDIHKMKATVQGPYKPFTCRSWLYRVSPMAKDTKVLMWGSTSAGDKEPVAWFRKQENGGKVLTTTLGHHEDFENLNFVTFLYNSVYWLLDEKTPKKYPSYKVYNDFVEEHFPFYTSALDSRKVGGYFTNDNLTARGIILKPGRNHYACFDTDLLKYSVFWKEGQISFNSMAPGSYHVVNNRKKSAQGERKIPVPEGRAFIGLGKVPGVETAKPTWKDPRPRPKDHHQIANGPLPEDKGRFNGVMLTEEGPVISYSIGKIEIFETLKAVNFQDTSVIERRIKAVNAKEKLYFHIGQFKDCAISTNAEFVFIKPGNGRIIGIKAISENNFTFSNRGEKIDLEVDPAGEINISLFIWEGEEKDLELFSGKKYKIMHFPDLNRTPLDYWPGTESTRALREKDSGDDEFILSEVVLPALNKQKRNVRASGIAFFEDGRAAVCTFDGDIWIVENIDQNHDIKWKRFASGLYEPQGLVIRDGKIFVFDRMGITRLHDRNNNGEADFYENFCSLPIQTGESREFAMDIALLSDGSFLIAKGGQRSNSFNIHAGSVIKISKDGRKMDVIANGLREPYIGIDPKNGDIYASDQQGHYIPSTPFHVLKKDKFYGFETRFDKVEKPETTEPVTWIPHSVVQSGASIYKIYSKAMKQFDGSILYLDYFEPSLGRVYYDPERPQEAVYLRLKQQFTAPLLKGAVNPKDGLLYLSGFQIWGSKSVRTSAIVRLQPSKKSLIPTNIRYFKQGVLLSFNSVIHPDSVNPHMFKIERWNYKRTNQYGSGHFTLSGKTGQEEIAPATATLSKDKKSVFIGIPDMKNTMQMAFTWRLLTDKNDLLEDTAYFSVNTLTDFKSLAGKFPKIDFDAPPIALNTSKAVKPTVELGKQTILKYGCVGCHSLTTEKEGKTGPAWGGLFDSNRNLTDGSTVKANAEYLKESILEPTAKAVKGYIPAMPSYNGILKDHELQSIILYIQSLK